MSNISFNPIENGITVSEPFEVSGDVCVHIECDELINILIEQKTIGDRFVETAVFNNVINGKEVDIAGKVYNKQVRVTCSNVSKLPVGYYKVAQ